MSPNTPEKRFRVVRVQTGVRMEVRLVKVLKGLAEHLDMTLGDLLEGIVRASFEGRSPFVAATLAKIEQLKQVYEMDYGAERSHLMFEEGTDA